MVTQLTLGDIAVDVRGPVTISDKLDINSERALPVCIDAERSILGTILLDNFAYREAAQTLSAGDFSLDAHRRIYRRMTEMAAENIPIDLITLVDALDRHTELEAVGDVGYVSGLTDGVPDRPSIEHYIRIVKEKAQLRSLIFAAQAVTARAIAGEKPADIAGALLATVMDVEAQVQQNHALTPRDFMPDVLRKLEMDAQSGGLVGLPTGCDPLNLVTGGWRPGELVVLGALPSAGKTAFAFQTVEANVSVGIPIAVFSLEMSRWDLGNRFLSAVTPVSASKIRHPGHITKDEWPKLAMGAAEIAEWPLWFDDSGSLSITELVGRARMFITRMKCRMIVVDYLQLVRADAPNIRERVGKVADALRQLAKAERVPVLLLSQLRRPQNMNDAPTMIDLKESGDIEAHAHVVLLLHVPIAPDGKPTGQDTIIVAKNRNGAKGPIPVTFSPHKLRFYPRTTK